jgi:selenocysteine-specific elongation factor
MPHDLILGTAGHIDHGKTALVRALTGVDTDRLPEEKRRGITIDLGFAQLDLGDYRLGVVDVPGHERFVRNMLAGAAGVDLALLVVSGVESVRRQTREHLDILHLLAIPAGVIAVTKCDLADADWLPLVEDEIRQLVAGTFLAQAPLIRTSAATGEGLPQLKAALGAAAAEARAKRKATAAGIPFRMPIDRAFTVAGVGAVVTGSIASGSVRTGDELVLEPGGKPVRVRGLQNHDQPVESLHAGQRGAINLSGVQHDELARGQVVAAPGFLRPTSRLTAFVQTLPSAPPLRSRAKVRVHLGTAEIGAQLVLLNGETLGLGAAGWVQLHLSETCVATWGQPLILRSESPVATLGGGRVVQPSPRILKARDFPGEILSELAADDPARRIAAWARLKGLEPWTAAELPREVGAYDGGRIIAELQAAGELLALGGAGRQRWVHVAALDSLGERVIGLLSAWHDHEPLRSRFFQAQVESALAGEITADLLAQAISRMVSAGKLQQTAGCLNVTGRGAKLTRNENLLFAELIERFRTAGLATPTVEEFRAQATKAQPSVGQLFELAAADGLLVKITAEYFLHAEVERAARETVAARLASGPLTTSEIRELLQTSRKFALPLCEYWDRSGFTRRQGDLRVLAEG